MLMHVIDISIRSMIDISHEIYQHRGI